MANNPTTTVENVTYLYERIGTPQLKKDSKTLTEFSVTVVVDEDTADAFGERYKNQKVKFLRNDEFTEKFPDIDLPYPNQKKQFMLTLKKDTHSKQGTVLPDTLRPHVYLRTGADEVEQITGVAGKGVGNGSKGSITWDEFTNSFGTTAKLLYIIVDDLVVYEGGTGGNGTAPAGLKVTNKGAAPAYTAPTANSDGGEVEVASSAPAKVVKKPPVKQAEPDYDDDTAPF